MTRASSALRPGFGCWARSSGSWTTISMAKLWHDGRTAAMRIPTRPELAPTPALADVGYGYKHFSNYLVENRTLICYAFAREEHWRAKPRTGFQNAQAVVYGFLRAELTGPTTLS